jgi:multisubunit Na+/H+ antiporter MnhC subunit
MVYDINKQGRIHKDAFVLTTALFYGFTVLAVLLRFLIRHNTQRSFSIDDFFLLIAFSALTAAFGILFGRELKYTYLFAALASGDPNVIPPTNIVPLAFERFKYVTVALWMCWTAILASKFSFLFFFRRLIERIWGLNVYWWAVLVYNVLAGGYGFSVYYLSCPYFYDTRSCKNCAISPGICWVSELMV